MISERQTVAACVFQGHAAGHDCRECPLVQVLVRRVRALGIEDSPALVDRELDKYRSLARVLNCPQLAKISFDHFFDVRCADRTALPRIQRRLRRELR